MVIPMILHRIHFFSPVSGEGFHTLHANLQEKFTPLKLKTTLHLALFPLHYIKINGPIAQLVRASR